MLHRSVTSKCIGVFVCILVAGWASAQTLSSIIGEVQDAGGAVIPNVLVTAADETTGFTRSGETNASGTYHIRLLPSGRYVLTVEQTGFNKFVDRDVYLAPSFQLRYNVTLEVGDVTESIEVTGTAPVIEAESGELATIQGGELFGMAVPIAGTGVFTSPAQQAMMVAGQNSGGWMTFGGSRRYQTHATMDGMDPSRGAISDGAPSNDGVQAVKTITLGAPAEYAQPVNIDMVTKSGTNELHFTAGVYFNNKVLNAQPPFAGARPPGISQWEPTITAGGPLYIPKIYDGRNKTFLFYTTVRQSENLTNTRLQTVPSAAMRAFDFSDLTDAKGNVINIKNPFTGELFSNNKIPPSLVPQSALSMQNRYFPEPTGPGTNLNYLAQVGRGLDQTCLCDRHMSILRLDQVIGQKDLLYITLNEGGSPKTHTDIGDQLWGNNLAGAGFVSEAGFNNGSVSVAETRAFSPSWFNEFRFGYHFLEQWQGWPAFPSDQFISELGLQGIPAASGTTGFPTLNVVGFNRIFNRGTYENKWQGYQIKNNVSWVAGRNEVKFGFNYKKNLTDKRSFGGSSFGNFSFTGRFTNQPYADFLLGLPNTVGLASPTWDNAREDAFGLFIQNKVRLTSNFTLDMGVRWQRYGVPTDLNGRHYNFDPQAGTVVVPTDQSKNLIDPAFPSAIQVVTATEAGFPEALLVQDSRLLPRLGFAYRLNDKNVFRGSYGMFASHLSGGGTAGNWESSLLLTGGPFSQSQSFSNDVSEGRALFQFPQAIPAERGEGGAQSVNGVNRNLKTPYSQQWNLTLEREIANSSVRLSYIGQRSVSMIYGRNINLPSPIVGVPFSTDRLNYAGFRGINFMENGGNTNYHAMQLHLQRSFHGGLGFQGGWTWAKNLSDIGWGPFPGPVGSTTDPFNRAAQKGNTDITPQHDMRFQWIYEIPVGKRRGGFLAANRGAGWSVLDGLIGGWSWSGMAWARTGFFFTPSFSGADPSGLGIFSGRPDAVAGCDPNQGAGGRRLNAGCFVVPGNAIGRFGDAGVGTLLGPGDQQIDLGLWKDFGLVGKEKPLNLTFGIAIFDLLNTGSYANPVSNITNANYGELVTFQRSYLSFGGKFRARAVEFRLRLTY